LIPNCGGWQTTHVREEWLNSLDLRVKVGECVLEIIEYFIESGMIPVSLRFIASNIAVKLIANRGDNIPVGNRVTISNKDKR